MTLEKPRFCDICNLPAYLTSGGTLHLWPDRKVLCSPCEQVRLLKEDKDEVRYKVLNSF